MTPVRRRDLAVLALGLAVASWLLVRAWYGDLPPLRWWLPVPLAVLAVAEALGARVLRVRLGALRDARAGRGPVDRDGSLVRPVEPMLVARLAVLAQASAYVGAVFTGLWLGVLVYAAPAVGRLRAAGDDTLTAGIGLVCSLALIAAALWLESACRVPPGSTDDDPAPGVSA
ncbi:DUF3180 domain-containing protein [Blastococcus xanthinilyticus]|uniref:Uncharacterized protein DUF3180 n=1 Tax=Blastococcus xanthinilyticus TaxID=1564164 RepID=A0A5S5CT73_9ACTN|nr:DUF3180 domain-containing protein [Blastococcus xanthinilyticus]TYP84790.1 uncharacterized protein DUF3180 [Blastococcus xanthinilyticus]